MVSKYTEQMFKKVCSEINEKQEQNLLQGLNELVSRGLLFVKKSAPVFTQDENTNNIVFSQSVELILKEQEYIEKLEAENLQMKEKLAALHEILVTNEVEPRRADREIKREKQND